jgi:2-phosphoglycerate kinase
MAYCPSVGWDVLLIGGGSGTGKTLVAPGIAARFAATVSQVDDFRLVLQRMLPPEVAPGLHFFVDRDLSPLSVEDALARHRAVVNFMTHALEPVIAHHVATKRRLVLEGDGMLPSLATIPRHAGHVTAGRVAAVFLEETDRDELEAGYRRRDRGFNALAPDEQGAMLTLQHRHGRWLADEARAAGIPVVPSRPWTTLEERIVALLPTMTDPRLA